ncbi:cupin domain-containing protein [Pelagibacterium lentulum]|uniref:Cupin n=1 Tax=Pelagibacterium lentulum TaxID=2029865 RepID=A0A916RHI3_9HYPH|nr:cupin domain-containing protein [Pelagibacterium lentulum]GGA57363.1 cupin [Pelagibacterium lentulum]
MTATWHIDPNFWHAEWEGPNSGSGVSFIFITTDETGYGPKLHRHPYPETFIVQLGRAKFYLESEEFVAVAGDIVVAPAGSAHRFENLGTGRLQMIDVHASPRFITEWLV